MTLLVEAPVARAVLRRMGRRRGMEVVAGLGTSARARTSAALAIHSKIEIYDRDGDIVIQSVFALREPTETEPGHYRDDGLYWDNEGIVARGRLVPESMAVHAVGRPITDLVSHPLLSGLTTADVRNEEDAVVIDVRDSLWTIERIEADA